ncbi:thiamine-phosphate kinase [Kerstersia gyiorum]|uniref:thiamine-phosphate kinase n=1 Tax=Kerstersia gyiorum TaxID=206506 RepID=UPI0020A0D7EC|nr:thiamine-phosphate kinase [Kerstersia gyiorum]MCP1633464.1 thiamine-monophosphate kinase [Kerstersia gyiorum]MCP1682047.1 thiamine-monophosphate kinase [Kerstersia gyiorum]MCP1717715.1 thiamine-monophosphate kinase [Kerstersia gyiorum]MCW2186567.1 thiamine-monophosphate kinase [Kerstersia gyiorum]
MAAEFDLIRKYFTQPAPQGMLGVGDDCALFPVPAGQTCAVSTDLLVEGRHFFPDVDPVLLGHKALAVNLSDLAAMGAEPLACVLGLSLPAVDAVWLDGFSRGFLALAREYGCPLVGGDTTRGPQVCISVTVFGAVPAAQALRRDAGRPGDDIWVSGTLGGADIALQLLQGKLPGEAWRLPGLRGALECPAPQLALGRRLRGIAHAAIDISDGLLQDLGHILAASACAARLDVRALPAHPGLAGMDEDILLDALLGGGDVYQLCFTAAPQQREQVAQAAAVAGVAVSRIGVLEAGPAGLLLDNQGAPLHVRRAGFDHFEGQS